MLKTAELNFQVSFSLKVQKNSIYLKYKSFVTEMSIIISDQFKASLLNKSINFYNIYSIIIVPPSILSESLLITFILFLYFKIYINIFL